MKTPFYDDDVPGRSRRAGRARAACRALAVVAAALPLAFTAGAQERSALDQELLAAALAGDAAQVEALLERGADVDARGDYDVTPISSAADQGHANVVRVLLRNGADPDVIDTFYEFAPLSRAMMNGHDTVVELLLAQGADPSPAVALAVQLGETDRLAAVLATGEVDTETLRRSLMVAEAMGMTAAVEVLEEAGAGRDLPGAETVALERGELRGMVGEYVNGQTGDRVRVVLRDDTLVMQDADDSEVTLRPIGERSFRGVGTDLQLDFNGRGGTVEFVEYVRGGRLAMLGPLDPDAAASREAASAAAPAAGRGTAEDVDPGPTPRSSPINWAGFRGPNASGIGDGQGIPTSWDIETGENVRWATPIPGIANSSPVVWGDRVFVTTAVSEADDTVRTGLYGDTAPVDDLSEHVFNVYAIDKETGDIVWEREVHRGAPVTKRHPKSSQANSTPVADARHVVAVFGTIGKLVCFDHDGGLLWERDLGVLDSGWFYDKTYQWGHGSSPVIYDGTVILQADLQGSSFIAAYDLDTGSERWRALRDEIPSWGTPTVYRGEPRDELITNGKTIRSYDPASGELLWRLTPNSELPVATPVVGDGIVYLSNSYPPIQRVYAVRTGGRGDLSLAEGETSSDWIVWSKTRALSYLPTPILYRGVFYAPSNDGRLMAYDARTGEIVYRTRIGGSPGSYVASPVAADGRLYFTTEECTVHVARAGAEFELLASNDMNDVCWATPAISDGLLVVRTLHNVYGIGY